MSSNDLYRTNAESCLRLAQTARSDKPFWLNLAQSWLQLAEKARSEGNRERERASSEAS